MPTPLHEERDVRRLVSFAQSLYSLLCSWGETKGMQKNGNRICNIPNLGERKKHPPHPLICLVCDFCLQSKVSVAQWCPTWTQLSDFTFFLSFFSMPSPGRERKQALQSFLIRPLIPFMWAPPSGPNYSQACRGLRISLFFLLNCSFCIGVQPINNVAIVLVNREQPCVHMHVSTLPQTPLPSRLPPNIEQSPLCYTGGPCW